MEKISVGVQRLEHFRGDLPTYETLQASGLDVRAQLAHPMVLKSGERALIPTGLAFEIPVGFEIQVRPRSGWALRTGMTLLNTPGTIDADCRGEVKVLVINLGDDPVTIRDQDRIAQLVVCPVLQVSLNPVESLSETARGDGGFGSTGPR